MVIVIDVIGQNEGTKLLKPIFGDRLDIIGGSYGSPGVLDSKKGKGKIVEVFCLFPDSGGEISLLSVARNSLLDTGAIVTEQIERFEVLKPGLEVAGISFKSPDNRADRISAREVHTGGFSPGPMIGFSSPIFEQGAPYRFVLWGTKN
ncbi:MAG TPA: hypothetical protein VHO84_09065 [Syntrophorhabdaceae bacterium]|nr:hypothetical protein [Syntrophorhabdaceae bacterium]